jgi:hypothetical protein
VEPPELEELFEAEVELVVELDKVEAAVELNDAEDVEGQSLHVEVELDVDDDEPPVDSTK